MAAIELVVTDLDGTLWDSQPVLHPRTKKGVEALAERNVRLLAASA